MNKKNTVEVRRPEALDTSRALHPRIRWPKLKLDNGNELTLSWKLVLIDRPQGESHASTITIYQSNNPGKIMVAAVP